MAARPEDSGHGSFWSVFEHSHIPMTLVDSDRRYAAANDAAVEFYGYPREQIIGMRAGSGMPDEDPAIGEAAWEELARTGELYGERLVRGSSGPPMRISYAAHATNVDGRSLALFVVLSAHVEPEGEELIGVGRAGSASAGGEARASTIAHSKRLTPREREIVQRVALGRSTPQIAAELGLSPATIRSHVRNAMVKAGAHTRAQLVALVLGDELASE
jgi:PAS domain S-box-containing protein